MKQHIHNL